MCRVNIGQPVNGDWPVLIDGEIALNIRPAEGEPNIEDWPFWIKSSRAFSTSLMDYGTIDECIEYFRIETGSEPRVFTVAYKERAGVNLPVLSDVYVEEGNFTVKYVSIK